MITLKIAAKTISPPTPSNTFVLCISFMHGDGDADSELKIPCGYDKAVQLIPLYKSLIGVDTNDDDNAKAFVADAAEKLGLDPDETWDMIHDNIPGDMFSEGGLAQVQYLDITWWDAFSNEHDVEIINDDAI
jgi:hypothetical protein